MESKTVKLIIIVGVAIVILILTVFFIRSMTGNKSQNPSSASSTEKNTPEGKESPSTSLSAEKNKPESKENPSKESATKSKANADTGASTANPAEKGENKGAAANPSANNPSGSPASGEQSKGNSPTGTPADGDQTKGNTPANSGESKSNASEPSKKWYNSVADYFTSKPPQGESGGAAAGRA